MHTLLEGFGLGLVGGIVPGSVLTILLVSVIQGGFVSGLRAFFFALLAEVSIVTVLLTILFNLPLPTTAFTYIGLIGGAVLLYFGFQVLKVRNINVHEQAKETFTPLKIFILSATNAPLYIFWVTICAPLIWEMAQSFPLFFSAITYTGSFEVGWSLSTFAVMLTFVYMRRYLTDQKIMHKVFIAVAAFMFLLGIKMLYTSVFALMS